MSEIRDFILKIESWRVIAEKQEDYFLKFAVEYFAFNALLKLVFFPNRKVVSDRWLIDKLKKDENCKAYYSTNAIIYIKKLKRELDRKPLINLTRLYSPLTIQDEKDWNNIIEAVYCIRNNLFHGEKYPGDERDQKLVKLGYHLIYSFNDYLIDKVLPDAQI